MCHTFSIIIPLYNCQDIIGQLLNNLKNQTYKNFDVIFIDDCSRDDTINEFEKHKDQIDFKYQLLTNHENKGPGISRNLCLDHITGQYVLFFDSDDTIDITTLEKINSVIDTYDCPDAILFDYFIVSEHSKIRCNTVHNQKEGFISKEDAMIYSTGSTWCKVYKSDIIKQNHVRFPNMRTKEDFVFNKIALSFCKTIYYMKDPLYGYMVNPSSIMNTTKLTGEANSKMAFDIIEQQIDVQYHSVVSVLKSREYLFGVIQSMVRMKKSNKDIKSFINAYEKQNSDWYKDVHTYQFDSFTMLVLKLAQKRAVLSIKGLVLFKNLLKKVLLR